MLQSWMQELIASQTDGGAGLTNTTPQSILAGQSKYTLTPQQLQYPGQTLQVYAAGRVSTASSSQGNITFDIRFGSVIVATSQAIALASSQTNITWQLWWELTVRAVGGSTSANLMHSALIASAALTTTPTSIPASAPAVGTGFDSTASQVVDMFLTFSGSSASNLLTCHQFKLRTGQ